MFIAIIMSVILAVSGVEQWFTPHHPHDSSLPDSVRIIQSFDIEDCLIITLDSIAVFQRPDSSADVWSMLAPFERVIVSGRTVDGWLGFDPGVAQAANRGSFRLRWISEDENIVIEGKLDSVSVIWGPEAGITYAMIYKDSPLFAEPDSLSMVIDSIPSGSAAGIVSKTEDWYLLDLNESPLEDSIQGWISSMSMSISGDPDSIPLQ
ncbi:MAG: hypothetical protein KAQ97_10105 [Candidatus Fermentibacteraceae bacterium]|nr:hypothetical protein [Candidatus Fermentibacteraceae bacterium]